MKIFMSTEYSKFKFVKGNRKIIQKHVNNMIPDLRKRNFIESHPIEVNENYEILDGQHRFEAAKYLSIPIYYTIGEGGLDSIVRCNMMQRKWKMEDYLNLYAEGYENPAYVKAAELKEKFELNITSLLIFTSLGNSSGENYKEFKEGKLDMEKVVKSEAFISKFVVFREVLKKKDFCHKFMDSKMFPVAFAKLFIKAQMDFGEFLKRLENNYSILGRRFSVDEYVDLLLQVYNKNRKYKVHADHMKKDVNYPIRYIST